MSEKIQQLFIGDNWSPAMAEEIVYTLQRNGFYITTEDPDAKDSPETEAPKEWIERQEEERRAWAIGEAVRYLRELPGTGEELVNVAAEIEKFVKGSQEDPDLHDQDALDNVAVSVAKVLGWTEPPETEAEGADRTRILDTIELECTKAGVRFKNGKVLDL